MVFFLVAAVLMLGRGMWRDLDVDESPFIASGALLARHGALPYRDYHYNHMPTEVIVYAGLFGLTNHLLLVARAFQSLCAAGLATALFVTAYGAARYFRDRGRLLFAWAIGLLLLANPLFTRTAGLSWNHDFPMLMAMLGFLALRRAMPGGFRHFDPEVIETIGFLPPRLLPSPQTVVLTIASGFLVAIAATSRLTFLPIAGAFVVLMLIYRHDAIIPLALFTAGFVLASLPSLWVWSQAWQNAYFGNFLYPRLNTQIHLQRDGHPHTHLIAILGWYLKSLFTLPGNGIVTVGFLVVASRTLKLDRIRRDLFHAELLAICAIAGVLLASGFMPAPPYPQYFYAATPFMILGIALCLGSSESFANDRRMWILPAALLGISILVAIPLYLHTYVLLMPMRWVPMQVHATGDECARRLGPGYVLTLEPLFPLEGGMEVDPRFTTGRFGLRAADLLSERERRQYLMPGTTDIPSLFDQNPPGSYLIVQGTADPAERAFIAAALAHGYKPITLASHGGHGQPKARAWVRPEDR